MSYPTPWRVNHYGDVRDARDGLVFDSACKWYSGINYNDLVSRINAGAEAEARAERAEKALQQAIAGLDQARNDQQRLSCVYSYRDDYEAEDAQDKRCKESFDVLAQCMSVLYSLRGETLPDNIATYLKEKEKTV